MLAVLASATSHAQTVVRTLSGSDDRGVSHGASEDAAESWHAALPPMMETPPVAASGGGYCFAGGHPVALSPNDPAGAPSWHDEPGVHVHAEPPLDARLFGFDGRCYHFIADPQDFGHTAATIAHHGMHPLPQSRGGGWCYFDGPHTHGFRLHSPYMQRIGDRYFWSGGFDANFRVHYPYFVYFHRERYALHYARGRYLRARQVAPPIEDVPMPEEMLSWGPSPPPQAAAQPPPAPASGTEPTGAVFVNPTEPAAVQTFGAAIAPPWWLWTTPPPRAQRQPHTPPPPPAVPPPPPPPPPPPRAAPAPRAGAVMFVK